MSSSIPTRLPIRAIPSAFATRASPSIPHASQTYEPLAKAVLRHRLVYKIFLFTLIHSWALATTWSIWSHGGFSGLRPSHILSMPFWPSTLLACLGIWVTVLLPIVVLRKAYLTATSEPASSPSKKLHGVLSKPRTSNMLLTYIASSICAVIILVSTTYSSEAVAYGNPRLSLFVQSKKHPYYLNGRMVFLLVSQICLAGGFTLRNIMLDRFVFRCTKLSQQQASHDRPFTMYHLLKALLTAILLSSFMLPLAAVSFAFTRAIILPVLFKLPLVSLALRPFTAHFLRGRMTVLLPIKHFSLLCRAWFISVSTMASWEYAEAIFSAYVFWPICVTHASPDPVSTLVSGISSPDGTLKHFAYLELSQLASEQSMVASARRTAFFGDQKYQPSLWSTLFKEGLVLLGHDYQLLLRRGQPPAAKPAKPAVPPQVPVSTTLSTPTKLIQKPIFYRTSKQSPIRSVIDSLASDGSFAQAVDAGAEVAHIPELFRSVSAAIPSPAPAKQEVKKKVEEARKSLASLAESQIHVSALLRPIGTLLPQWIGDTIAKCKVWWTKDRTSRIAEGSLPNRDLDVLVIEVLTYLTCASLTEDRYGVVQRNIPQLLEALLSFLTAVEDCQKEINSLYVPPDNDALRRMSIEELERSEETRVEVSQAGEVVSVLGDALKEGIVRIVRTFEDKLMAFKFPPSTAQKLQGFVDYY